MRISNFQKGRPSLLSYNVYTTVPLSPILRVLQATGSSSMPIFFSAVEKFARLRFEYGRLSLDADIFLFAGHAPLSVARAKINARSRQLFF